MGKNGLLECLAICSLCIQVSTGAKSDSQLKNVLSLLSQAHADRASLLEQLSKALFLAHPGPSVGAMTTNAAARKKMSLAERADILTRWHDQDLFDFGTEARQVQVDDEDGGPRRTLSIPYHMLPLYGRLPDTHLAEPRPKVLVTVSMFEQDPQPGASKLRPRYSEGLLQMVHSLPHINRRMDLHLAVFHDDTTPQSFLQRVRGMPHTTLVPVDQLATTTSTASCLLQVKGFETTTARYRWHDVSFLQQEGLPQTGMGSIPDIVMSYDVDSLLDSPALDWWVQHVMRRPEHMFLMEGTSALGPNNIPRAFDASTFTVAPKRTPKGFKWPTEVGGDHQRLLARSTSGTALHQHKAQRTTLRNRGSTSNSFYSSILKSLKDGYGIDEEILTLLVESIVERDGPQGVHVSNWATTDAFITATLNTGENEMMCNGLYCNDELDGLKGQQELTYALRTTLPDDRDM